MTIHILKPISRAFPQAFFSCGGYDKVIVDTCHNNTENGERGKDWGAFMKRLRLCLAIITGKILITLSRLMGNQGTDFPGRMARKIYPDILKSLSSNITEEIIVVTGTNGKTTTSNMIARIIEEKGYTLVHNTAGANMLSGITTAFINASDISGARKFDYALLETDEANVPLLLEEIKVRMILITNFFRDQLDRYGELDRTINLIKDAVRETEIELILNADDPLVVHFHNDTGLHCWYYGFANTNYDSLQSRESREGRYCVFCGEELNYERFHYAQLGKFSCPKCGSTNPVPNFTGHGLSMDPTINFKVNDLSLESPYQGFYNAYNILAAVALAKLEGIEDPIIHRAISSYQPRAGRMEQFIINGKRTILILVKNPAGFNQTLSALLPDPSSKDVFIALNDNAADGRDISWIWDSDLELLAEPRAAVNEVTCSGQRSGDMAVRVKYAGIKPDRIRIRSNLEQGIEAAINDQAEATYILSTYTALFECQAILKKMQGEKILTDPGQQRQMQA